MLARHERYQTITVGRSALDDDGRTIAATTASCMLLQPTTSTAVTSKAEDILGLTPSRHQSLEGIVASAWALMVRRGLSEAA